MKKFFILFCLIISCSNPTENNEIDSKIDLQISQMTLKEKIGQMAQINLTVITEGPDKWSSFEPIKLDSKKLRKAILEYKIGSVLNTANNQARKPELWNKIIGEIQNVAINESRLGIPVIYGIDAIHGATYTDGATMFPQQITTAASWNTENAYNMAQVPAYEIKAR